MLKPYTDSVTNNLMILEKTYEKTYKDDTSKLNICKNSKTDIYRRFCQYDVNHNIVVPISTMGTMKNIHDTLVKLYTHRPVANPTKFQVIYDYTFELNDGICAYCLVRSTTQVDHFLPKNEFPEYAALAKNLLPICSTCNQNRRRKITTFYTGRIRENFNLYFDNFVPRMFVYKLVWIQGMTFINIKIDYSNRLNSIQLQILKEHFSHIHSNKMMSLHLEYAQKIELFFKQELISHIDRMYDKDNFEDFWKFLNNKILTQLNNTYDFLWFNKSYALGDVDTTGLYNYLNYIYLHLDNLDSIELEMWVRSELKRT